MSYETLELIASHHAELERLCNELLELGSWTTNEADASLLRERVRALGWRLREHLTSESSALLAEAKKNPRLCTALLDQNRAEFEWLADALAKAEREKRAPLELVSAICAIARDSRAHLDKLAHEVVA